MINVSKDFAKFREKKGEPSSTSHIAIIRFIKIIALSVPVR